MYFWEYILNADRDSDLSDPRKGRNWFFSQHRFEFWSPPYEGERPVTKLWKSSVLSKPWTANIRALRYLGASVARFDSRVPAADEETAIDLCQAYIERLVPFVVFDPPDVELELNLHDFKDDARMTKGEQSVAYALDVFWQLAFGSLAIPSFPRVCRHCGGELKVTPTGRQPLRDYCSECRHSAWRKEQGEAAMRAKWVAQKRRQRARGSN